MEGGGKGRWRGGEGCGVHGHQADGRGVGAERLKGCRKKRRIRRMMILDLP